MGWFNYLGLIMIVVLLTPNIICYMKNKEAFDNNSSISKGLENTEKFSRLGSMLLLVFNIPYTYIGFYFDSALVVYIIINSCLLLAYVLTWIILWKKNTCIKALLLSLLPTIMFVFSGIMVVSIPLIILSIIFMITHIMISMKSGLKNDEKPKKKKRIIITLFVFFIALVSVVILTIIGIITNRLYSLKKLDSMSISDMIEYDVTSGNKKISIAYIDHGNITYYVNNRVSDEIYDYEIGSLSKTFVGLLISKAEAEHKLSLDDSISKYLDLEEDKYYPTIERLLTHTSGYKPYYFEGQMIKNKLAQVSNDFYGISKNKIIERVRKEELSDRDYPFEYSNFGIAVVGLVLESIYKTDFTSLMNAYIKNELGLSDTAVLKEGRNLSGYWSWQNQDGYIPAGAIKSNIVDMANYLSLYMNNSLDYIGSTTSKIKTINANNQVYEKMNIRMDAIGMTWVIDETNNLIWHNGGTSKFNTYMGFNMEKTRGVVILSNLGPNERISMSVIGAKILIEGYR